MKYMKILFYVSIILIVNLSCNENVTNPEYLNSFFPLKAGSKWFYNSFNYNTEQFNPQNVNVIKTIT